VDALDHNDLLEDRDGIAFFVSTTTQHEPTDHCRSWHCHIHDLDECGGFLRRVFMVCDECGHLYKSAFELRRRYAAICLRPSERGTRVWRWLSMAHRFLTTSVQRITFCPVCSMTSEPCTSPTTSVTSVGGR
jgi:hypothetical protein